MLQRISRSRLHRPGFTLLELMVVIGVIVVLLSILIPAVSVIRGAAKEASTKALIAELSGAIDRYHGDFRAYPGPIPNDWIHNSARTDLGPPLRFQLMSPVPGYDTSQPLGSVIQKITMSENLVLGLLGGLRAQAAAAGPGYTGLLFYDPSLVGGGPMSLLPEAPKKCAPYLSSGDLSWRETNKTGHFADEVGEADDTIIPEFVDRFTDPMPILYLRAKAGATRNATIAYGPQNNTVITYGVMPPPGNRYGQYDLSQIIAYTGAFTGTWPNLNINAVTPPAANARTIGVGKNIDEVCENGTGTMKSMKNKAAYHGLRIVNPQTVLSANAVGGTVQYYYPYNAYAYFRDPALSNVGGDNNYGTNDDLEVPRQKDGYILISAGKDRVYGTDDDITNFGSVTPK